MSRKIDRHPVRWPRMKIRGRRRRALAAARFEQVIYLPSAMVRMLDARTFEVSALPAGSPGSALRVSRVVDGFGRPVRGRR